jgi:hypothetical protein
MNINLDLKPEAEALLTAQAAAKGVSVEQYLKFWIESNLPMEVEASLPQTKTSQNWADLLEAFCNNPALANVPPLSDEAIADSAESVLSPSERAERFVNWAKSHASKVPPLSDEAISRESIYREREDQQL